MAQERMSDRVTTHWDHCYLDPKHHACAVGLVGRLNIRIAELEAERDAILNLMREQADAPRVRALAKAHEKLTEAQRERDRLIERWPSEDENGLVYRDIDGQWVISGEGGPFPTREAAVRAAAGLDKKGGPDGPAG